MNNTNIIFKKFPKKSDNIKRDNSKIIFIISVMIILLLFILSAIFNKYLIEM